MEIYVHNIINCYLSAIIMLLTYYLIPYIDIHFDWLLTFQILTNSTSKNTKRETNVVLLTSLIDLGGSSTAGAVTGDVTPASCISVARVPRVSRFLPSTGSGSTPS